MRVILLLTLAHFVAASSWLSVTHPSRALAAAELEGVVARQSPPTAVPSTCKTDCDKIEAETVSEECPIDECCQDDFVNGYFNCLKCIGGTLNVTDYNPAQRVLDDLIVQCDVRGLNVTKLSLPGIDPNHPLPPAPARDPNAPPLSTIPIGSSAPFPSSSSTGTSPQATSAASSAKSVRFLSPHFSHMPASAVLLGGFIYLVV